MSASPVADASTGSRPAVDVTAAEEHCVSCGRPMSTAYCPRCGERRAADRRYSLWHFAHEAVAALTNADGTLLRTLRTLIRRPGELTAAYLRGERVPYMGPFQLFLVLNVAFFLVSTWTGTRTVDTPLWVHMNWTPYREIATRAVEARLQGRGVTLEQYRAVFDPTSTTQAKSLVILMVPMFALAVALVSVRKRRYALQHVVFSLHTFSALLLAMCTVAPLVMLLIVWTVRARVLALSSATADTLVTGVLAVGFAVYVTLALRRAYGDGWAAAATKALALWLALGLSLTAYRFVLFFTTFWAT